MCYLNTIFLRYFISNILGMHLGYNLVFPKKFVSCPQRTRKSVLVERGAAEMQNNSNQRDHLLHQQQQAQQQLGSVPFQGPSPDQSSPYGTLLMRTFQAQLLCNNIRDAFSVNELPGPAVGHTTAAHDSDAVAPRTVSRRFPATRERECE